MIKLIRATATLLILFTLFSLTAKASESTLDIVKKNMNKVVMIITFDSNDQPLAIGSGFYISDDGKIATNYHVIEGAASAIIKEVGAKSKFSIDKVIQLSAEYDLAIIKVNKMSIAVEFGNDDKLMVGENVVAIGNPEGLEGTVSEGIISGFRSLSKDFRIIQITTPISPGSSGGPLFNF